MSFAVAILATAALANPDPGSDYSASETRKLVGDYGRCVVEKAHRLASEAIVRNVDNATLVRDYPRLLEPACVGSKWQRPLQMRFFGDQYRYALADALVRADFAASPPPDFEAVAPLDHRVPTPVSRVDKKGRPMSERKYAEAMKDYKEAESFSYLSRYGECVVRVDSAQARALLMTEPQSAQEKARFDALGVAFGTCLPEGRTLSFGKLAVRGTIAVNYYRLATAARLAGNPGVVH